MKYSFLTSIYVPKAGHKIFKPDHSAEMHITQEFIGTADDC